MKNSNHKKHSIFKKQYNEFLILIKNNDYYETFDEDAKDLYDILGEKNIIIDNNNCILPINELIENQLLVLKIHKTIALLEKNKLLVIPKLNSNKKPYEIYIEENTCFVCKEEKNNKFLLCETCYSKYKNKKLFFELNAKNNLITFLDASYEGKIQCDDGHIVKSLIEREIDNYLFDNNIKHSYEVPITINNNIIHPDFCLYINNEKIYLEYWGIEDNEEYESSKNFKMNLYKQAGITLINLYKKTDFVNTKKALEYKLLNYKKGEINF